MRKHEQILRPIRHGFEQPQGEEKDEQCEHSIRALVAATMRKQYEREKNALRRGEQEQEAPRVEGRLHSR